MTERGGRAGLIIGQTGQMPGASRLDIKTLLYWLFIVLGSSPCFKIVVFLLLRLVYRSGKLITLVFIIFE